MRELQSGLWHWEAPHPDWPGPENEALRQRLAATAETPSKAGVVSSYAGLPPVRPRAAVARINDLREVCRWHRHTVSWYERLGFRKEWEHQFEPGFPWFLSVARGSVRLYLSEHKGDARPNTLIHLYVNDIDVVSDEFGIPVDEEGLAGRECDLEDPDGNRLRVATRRS